MNLKELEDLLLEAMQNGDKAPANIKAVIDEIKAANTLLETQKEKIITQETRIRDLQDTNMKLFLSQSTPEKQEEEIEEINPVEILLKGEK